MLKFLITDENFDQIASQHEVVPMGIVTELHKSKNAIKINTNTMAPFAIFKWEQAGHFAISNKLEQIAKYISKFGYELTYTPVASKYAYIKPYVDQARNCDVQKITRWNLVIIDKTGKIKVKPPKLKPYSIPLESKRGVNLLLKWLEKYLLLAKQLIQENNFIPTLTGGLDTRTLTWFWRDLYQGSNYWLKAVKPDGKNNIDRGQTEIEIATQVLNRLGKSLVRLETQSNITFSGMFTENGRLNWCKNEISHGVLNTPKFIYDYIVFHVAENTKQKYFGQSAYPFVDNLYLQLKHPEYDYMRTLLALLLCPDLLEIPLCGFSADPTYLLGDKFAHLIPRVEKFIQKYHLRESVAKIKAKVLKSL